MPTNHLMLCRPLLLLPFHEWRVFGTLDSAGGEDTVMMLSSLPSRECMTHRSALQRSLHPQPCDEPGTQANTSVVFPAACLELGTVEKQAFLFALRASHRCTQGFQPGPQVQEDTAPGTPSPISCDTGRKVESARCLGGPRGLPFSSTNPCLLLQLVPVGLYNQSPDQYCCCCCCLVANSYPALL